MKKIIIDGHGIETLDTMYFRTPQGCGRRRLYSFQPANTFINRTTSNELIKKIIKGDNVTMIANYYSSYLGDAHLIANRALMPRGVVKKGREVFEPEWYIEEAELARSSASWIINGVKMIEKIIEDDLIYLTISLDSTNMFVWLNQIIEHYDYINDEIEFYWMACR